MFTIHKGAILDFMILKKTIYVINYGTVLVPGQVRYYFASFFGIGFSNDF